MVHDCCITFKNASQKLQRFKKISPRQYMFTIQENLREKTTLEKCGTWYYLRHFFKA